MQLHYLRDGVELPYSHFEKLRWVDRRLSKERLEELKEFTARDYLCAIVSKSFSSPEETREIMENPANLELAEKERLLEITQLERQLQPKKILALAERRKIWKDLWQARTPSSLQKACGEWAILRDVRSAGLTCWPSHILANSREFLRMKKQGRTRFPYSGYANDDSRLEYLARGMAGVLAGISPITAIERLRNMKHDARGPLWNEKEKRCDCWRCETKRSDLLADKLNETWRRELKS